MNWRSFKISISVVLLLLIITLSFAHVPDNSTTYSIVHLSDTQNLASAYTRKPMTTLSPILIQ